MPLLYYWRADNYARDQRFGFGFHLNQNSPAMSTVAAGDSLWAFTQRRSDGSYVLAAELVVRALTKNPANYRYGQWRIWGDLHRSRYFDVDFGPRVEPVIRALGVKAAASRLGQSFQGHAAVRLISPAAHRMLAEFTRDVPVVETAAIYPEDEFEARLVHDEPIRKLMVQETSTTRNIRVHYLFESVDVRRARKNIQSLHELYGGRCQICLYDPQERYGHRICHGHHIQWLSRGGEDELENMVLVCPNHHGAIHKDDAPFDYGDFSFRFTNGLCEPLAANYHLPSAN